MYSFYYILQAKLSLTRLCRALVVTQNYIINKYYVMTCFYLPRKISAFLPKLISQSPIILQCI